MKKSEAKKNGKVTNPKKAMDAVNAYKQDPDPLGSYSGITPEMSCMPRKRVDGKVYMRVDEKPVQDADDL